MAPVAHGSETRNRRPAARARGPAVRERAKAAARDNGPVKAAARRDAKAAIRCRCSAARRPFSGQIARRARRACCASAWAGRQGGDPMQMLSRAPAIQFADLKKGDAVMLVSTDGATDVTAITLLAGVEPLLEAPAASQMLLNNWSMNSGAGAAEAEAQ